MSVTRSESARADAFSKNPFLPSPERQATGGSVPEVPYIPPPAPAPAGPARQGVSSRFAHMDIAHLGEVDRYGSQSWIRQVPDYFDRERDIFHVELQCMFAAPAKFDGANPCDSYNGMLFARAPWFDDHTSQERKLMELYPDDEELLPGGI